MNYPALSSTWRLDMATKPRADGETTVKNHSKILAAASQIFPLSFFPDNIVIEQLRIVWLKRKGPWMDEVVSIMATDIASVNCATGLIFGHIHVQSLTGGPEIMVDNLLKKDVLRIRSLVEELALSAREGLQVYSQNLDAETQNLIQANTVN